jgi:hypothetical protein
MVRKIPKDHKGLVLVRPIFATASRPTFLQKGRVIKMNEKQKRRRDLERRYMEAQREKAKRYGGINTKK